MFWYRGKIKQDSIIYKNMNQERFALEGILSMRNEDSGN